MTTLRLRLTPLVLCLAAFWSSGSHALLIDDFSTDALALADCAAVCSASVFTPDAGAGMIGDRTIDVDKTAGPSGIVNAAIGEVTGGVMGMANGPVTLSTMTLTWDFALTDLTEGGTNTGIFFSLPSAIDNDLTVGFSVNGGTEAFMVYPNGSIGLNFFIGFDELANSGDAATATTLSFSFSNGAAWDAQIDFVSTTPDPGPEAPEPATLALFGLGLAGLGWSRRKKRHS